MGGEVAGLPPDLPRRVQVPQIPATANMGSVEGQGSLSFRLDGDTGRGSLILYGRNGTTEISIPAPLKSSDLTALPTATTIQSISGPPISGTANIGADDRSGAVMYIGPKGSAPAVLYWTSYIYYNVDGNDYNSLGWSDLNFGTPNSRGAWHIGPTPVTDFNSPYHGVKYGDYIIPIDQTWADQHTNGRSVLVGRYREAGADGGSMGPVLTAIAPWQDGNPPATGSNLSATPLMYFNCQQGQSDLTWMNWKIVGDPKYQYYSAGDHWNGGAWVSRGAKKAIVLVGRHGTYDGSHPCPQTAHGGGCFGAVGTTTPPGCYGDGGVDCPWGIAVTNSHGYHAGPYVPRLVFIDPDDLAAVAAGTKDPHTVNAYAMYDPSTDWPWTDVDGFNSVPGAAYNSTRGLLYVVQAGIYQPGGRNTDSWPVIHVYQVNAEPAEKTPPAAPRGLHLQ